MCEVEGDGTSIDELLHAKDASERDRHDLTVFLDPQRLGKPRLLWLGLRKLDIRVAVGGTIEIKNYWIDTLEFSPTYEENNKKHYGKPVSLIITDSWIGALNLNSKVIANLTFSGGGLLNAKYPDVLDGSVF